MEAALVASDVTKTYGDTRAIDEVSLTVHTGEVLALVGPNGAGKTTLVRLLTGTVAPTDGDVQLLGSDPVAVDNARIGVLPQSFSPPERLTAREVLSYYAGLYDDSRDPDVVLTEVGLAGVADTWYERLSGGQQRRVCLGAVLINEPDVLVLDEPTTGIDPAGRRTVRRHVAELAGGGTTVLVTTHDMDEAERLADRVALLSAGRLRAVDGPEALVEEHGGPPRVLVQVTADADPEAAVDSLSVAGYDASRTDSEISVAGVRADAIGGVVDTLDDAGIDYDGFAWRQPSLEDAYIALAGDEEGGIGRPGEVIA